MASSALERLIGRMRNQYEQIHGREPNGKDAAKLEKQARAAAEQAERGDRR